MSYLINRSDGTELLVLEDGTINTATSLSLVGKNTIGYGEIQNENFLFLLENFSNEFPPSRPISGQLWYDITDNVLKIYDGTNWVNTGSASSSETEPTNPGLGSFWLRTTDNTINVWDGSSWRFVGPDAVEGFAETRHVSTTLLGQDGLTYPVIVTTINGVVVAVFSASSFNVAESARPTGFDDSIIEGMNVPTTAAIKGRLEGVADRATILDTTRTINGIGFNGSSNITIKASTTNSLLSGDYILGNNFDGSAEREWSVDATPNNTVGKIVARDVAGDFSAGTITADLVGDVSGNVTTATGTSTFNVVRANSFIGETLSGNAFSASKLQTARTINGVLFDGTENIQAPSNAFTLTGNEIAPNVLYSSLQRVGTLDSLSISDTGVSIGSSNQLNLNNTSQPEINATGQLTINLNSSAYFNLITAADSLAAGGDNTNTIFGNGINLGHSVNTWNKVYANEFIGDLTGNADTATSAITATNLAGGGAGTIPYQTANSTTSMLVPGIPGQVLKLNGSSIPTWSSVAFSELTPGNYLTGLVYNGNTNTTWNVDATNVNTASKIVARDASGNFSAGTITATLNGNVTGNVTGNVNGNVSGNVTGNAGTATRLQTARTINGVSFDGTSNITIDTNSGDAYLDRVYSQVFQWGDGITSQNLELRIDNGTQFFNPDMFLIHTDFTDYYWFRTNRNNSSNIIITNKVITTTYNHPSGANDTFLSFTISSPGYPTPNKLIVDIYVLKPASGLGSNALTDSSSLTLISSSRPTV